MLIDDDGNDYRVDDNDDDADGKNYNHYNVVADDFIFVTLCNINVTIWTNSWSQ